MLNMLHKIQSISLKWKLLIPFLLFSFLGTTSLVYMGLSSQQELIKKEEKNELRWFYHLFIDKVTQKGKQALSMATILAENPKIQELLAERDREALMAYILPLYRQLKKEFGIRQFHFHIPPGKSFLRVHAPQRSGEMISYRRGVMDVLKGRQGIQGLEWGLTGLGIRGIVPIFAQETLVGSIEIGFPFGKSFLQALKATWGPDFTVFEHRGGDFCPILATTMEKERPFCFRQNAFERSLEQAVIEIAPPTDSHRSVFMGPVKDYQGENVAVVEIDMDRSSIVKRLAKTRDLMVLVGIIGICISFIFVWFVAGAFIRPIKEMVSNAREIAEGKRERRITPGPEDEIGVLAHALNTMLGALQLREKQIEDYAKTLEKRVQERTADLVLSEEKYRTLVDNLPLVVYRLLGDGTTEFVNPYFTSKLGFSPDEVVGNKRFWQEQIWGYEPKKSEQVLERLVKEKQGFRAERGVKDKWGHRLTFIDHAIPVLDDAGEFKWIEGIMVDITELKRLQEKALRTEEMRVLGEISSRFAHEMRNPLATAGGFARRLRDSLREDAQHRKLLSIIVEEVARMEKILKIILSSIEPFTLSISRVNFNELVQGALEPLKKQILAKDIILEESLSPAAGSLHADGGLLHKAFDNLLKHAVVSIPHGERLFVSTRADAEHLVLIVRHKGDGLSQEDVDQFFYPHITGKAESTILELPLSKIIIHRHGGTAMVYQEGEDIVLTVELPYAPPAGMEDLSLDTEYEEVNS
ncbi:MAG: PAS domain S-box protein [Deltaproteobacteria bacterium]|nr:PAS domain S-box protein [Deltaproteobacteria bacterium]